MSIGEIRDPWKALVDAAESIGMALSETQDAFSKLGESLGQSLQQLNSFEQRMFVDTAGSDSFIYETTSNVLSSCQDNSRTDFLASANPAFPDVRSGACDQAPDERRKRAISLGGVR